jgi:hypothetical protein
MRITRLAESAKLCFVLTLFIATAYAAAAQVINNNIGKSMTYASRHLPLIEDDQGFGRYAFYADPEEDITAPPKKINIEKISFRSTSFSYPENSRSEIGIAYYPPSQLILYASLLKAYAIKKGYDTNYVFLCNMGIVSNKKRFYIFNLKTMRIENAGLVSQGKGSSLSTFNKKYSNEPGSNCTALGRYKISGRYQGEYGESFKLYGLDSTNNKAFARRIVLHSMPCIPDTDAAMPPCASEGCPAVSPSFLDSMKAVISSAKKPILLWIFDSNLQDLVLEE